MTLCQNEKIVRRDNYIALLVMLFMPFAMWSSELPAAFRALSAEFTASSATFEALLETFAVSVFDQAARPSEAATTSEKAMVLVMGKPLRKKITSRTYGRGPPP